MRLNKLACVLTMTEALDAQEMPGISWALPTKCRAKLVFQEWNSAIQPL
jgi:hypothetical protein